MAASSRGRLLAEWEVKKEFLQLVVIGEDSAEENEVALCETVVEAAVLVPIMLKKVENIMDDEIVAADRFKARMESLLRVNV